MAFDGYLSGCTVCADINGNGGCDGGEPTATTNVTGGYSVQVTEAQIAAMRGENGGILLQTSDTCTDVYTGVAQRAHLEGSSGAVVISPLTTMAAALSRRAFLATPATATPVETPAAVAAAARQGRRLSTSFESFMTKISTNLQINQTHVLGSTDLDSYDPYESVKVGRDYCMASGIMARTVEAQAMAIQSATVISHYGPRSDGFASAASKAYLRLASFIESTGFKRLENPSDLNGTLIDATLPREQVAAITEAMANSVSLVEASVPKCPPMEDWESALLTEHNMMRALHCSAPMTWDESLVASASAHARTCPADMDTRSTPFSENVASSSTPTNDPAQAAPVLFDLWKSQKPSYATKYGKTHGPCPGGMNYTTDTGFECIANTATNRVGEFTQIMWQSHTTVGCAFSQCAFGNVLVCHYGGSTPGNMYGEFDSNVLPLSSRGAGPCNTNVWPSVLKTAKSAKIVDELVPSLIESFLAGSMSASAFAAATTLSALETQAANASIPLDAPMPPAPPAYPIGRPPISPPMPPLSSITGAQTAEGQNALIEPDQGWVFAVVLILVLLFLFFCIGFVAFYRIAGGEPGVWVDVHLTHSNENRKFLYMSDEEREHKATSLAIYQKAMSDAMAAYPSKMAGLWNMRRDHINFKKAGGLKQAQSEVSYEPPIAETKDDVAAVAEPQAATGADAQAAAPTGTAGKALPDEPCIDTELDQEFAESPEDRVRRIEWIKYFVREGDLQRAFDLGWDGKPFRQAQVLGEGGGAAKPAKPASKPAGEAPAGAPSPPSEGKKPASSGKAPAEPAADAGASSSADGAAAAPGEAGPSSVPPDTKTVLHRI